MKLEFVFDYRSPYAYLANLRLATLEHPVEYFLIDTLAVMKAVNNQPSSASPAKLQYARRDIARWAAHYQVPLSINTALFQALGAGEIEGSLLVRAGLAAQQAGVFDTAHKALFDAVWTNNAELTRADGRREFLRAAQLDVDLWQLADTAAIREQLAAHNDSAATRGVFGVPSFFVDDELFFGNDRLEQVRAALKTSKEV
ncbi:DsbA family protein [Pseudomonas sp. SDO528_S397]